jgi:hypothetical protein
MFMSTYEFDWSGLKGGHRAFLAESSCQMSFPCLSDATASPTSTFPGTPDFASAGGPIGSMCNCITTVTGGTHQTFALHSPDSSEPLTSKPCHNPHRDGSRRYSPRPH